jgi:hypothetical protein
VNRILSDFAGLWKIEREVTPADGPAGRFLGGAECTDENGLMIYKEKEIYKSRARADGGGAAVSLG